MLDILYTSSRWRTLLFFHKLPFYCIKLVLSVTIKTKSYVHLLIYCSACLCILGRDIVQPKHNMLMVWKLQYFLTLVYLCYHIGQTCHLLHANLSLLLEFLLMSAIFLTYKILWSYSIDDGTRFIYDYVMFDCYFPAQNLCLFIRQ